MDFDLNSDQVMVRNMARDFAAKEILPTAAEDDTNEHYRPETTEKMAALGLLGAPLPQEYGGAGFDYISYLLICEEIARASAGVFTTCLTVQTSLFQLPILRFGSQELKQKYLPRTTKGELLGCFAMTETGSGSDVAATETSARLDGDKWVLNGSKMWISNGGIADVALVFAQTDKAKLHRGITAFLVERKTPGFSSRNIHNKLGLRDSNTAEIVLHDCVVPAENILGGSGDGFKVGMYALDCARLSTAAACVGVGQAAIDAAVKYARERKQFGKPIGGFQLIQEMVADMVTETEVARYFVYRAGDLKEKDRPFVREASIAKYYAAEAAVRTAQKAIKIHGGYGYSNEYPVGRLLRDAVGLQLYEGTAEIQKLIIGRETLGIAAFV
ncbi:MAG: acyl-CoA dehydrogenase family protein [Dehalococcoidales bacterium]|nr:acyl-CoA dehydrogenase family protein [Dehalococcoidales bacterium]